MGEKMLKMIQDQKKQLVPTIFTKKQIFLIEKYLKKQPLTNTEKTYFYGKIKKKVNALNSLHTEFYITGQQMIPERVEEAKKLLKELNKERTFISGSFLFKKDYEDIDIYVISKKRKSYHKGKKHFIFITEKMIQNPIFFSSLKYSVANFSMEIKPIIKREEFGEILFIYQWVINQILEKEDQKELRNLVFNYYLQIKNTVLDSHSLYQKTEEIKILPIKKRITVVNQITKDILLKTYSKKYTYNGISAFSQDFKKIKEEYNTRNIPIFLDFAQEVKNECRRFEV
jgi:hypothetical protein